MEQIIEMMEELMTLVVNNDKIFQLRAKTMKKFFDALIAEGFTKEEALALTVKHGAINFNTK